MAAPISSAARSPRINLGQLPAVFLMLGIAGRLVREPWAYAATGALSLLSLIGMLTMHGLWIVFWAAILGFTGAVTLILALALPSVLSAPDDVHRTSAGMFTISYSCRHGAVGDRRLAVGLHAHRRSRALLRSAVCGAVHHRAGVDGAAGEPAILSPWGFSRTLH